MYGPKDAFEDVPTFEFETNAEEHEESTCPDSIENDNVDHYAYIRVSHYIQVSGVIFRFAERTRAGIQDRAYLVILCPV